MAMFQCDNDGNDPRLFVDAHGSGVYIEADEMGECLAAMYVSPDTADAIAAALYAAAESVRARSGEPVAAIVESIETLPDRVVLHVGSCDHVVSRSFVERLVRSAAVWLAAGDERKVA